MYLSYKLLDTNNYPSSTQTLLCINGKSIFKLKYNQFQTPWEDDQFVDYSEKAYTKGKGSLLREFIIKSLKTK